MAKKKSKSPTRKRSVSPLSSKKSATQIGKFLWEVIDSATLIARERGRAVVNNAIRTVHLLSDFGDFSFYFEIRPLREISPTAWQNRVKIWFHQNSSFMTRARGPVLDVSWRSERHGPGRVTDSTIKLHAVDKKHAWPRKIFDVIRQQESIVEAIDNAFVASAEA